MRPLLKIYNNDVTDIVSVLYCWYSRKLVIILVGWTEKSQPKTCFFNHKQVLTILRSSLTSNPNKILAVFDMFLFTTGHFCMCVFCKKICYFPL